MAEIDPAKLTLWQISSVFEYLLDRGEIEDVQKVMRPVRYTKKKPLDHVDVKCQGKTVRITAAVIEK